MNKRVQTDIYKILLFILIGIILIAGIIFSVWYILDKNQVDCGKGELKTIDGKKVCVFQFENSLDCKDGVVKDIDGKKVCVVDKGIIKEQINIYCGDGFCDDHERVQGICPEDCANQNVHVYESCSSQNGIICNNQNCSGTLIKMVEGLCCLGSCRIGNIPISQTHSICQSSQCIIVNGSGSDECSLSEDCVSSPSGNLSDVPYSFLAVHFEIDPNNNESAAEIWQNMVGMVELANQYHTPLTIMFWPGSARYVVSSPERLSQVRQWQAQGHEIGIHNQGCSGVTPSCVGTYECYNASANEDYITLAGDHEIKSGTIDACEWLLPSFKYDAEGRYDGRSSVAVKYSTLEGHEIYALNIKAGYPNVSNCGGTQIKILQYNTLKSNEIYGFVNHAEGDVGNRGGTVELKKWLEFLSSKDLEGKKRMTLSDIMEKYVLPNNLVISQEELCNSTDVRVQQCLPLAKVPEKSGAASCRIGTFGPDIFNLGRCLRTGTYCSFKDILRCEGPTGYCPAGCIIKGINEFDSSEQNICANAPTPPPICGDEKCSVEPPEKQTCPQDCWN